MAQRDTSSTSSSIDVNVLTQYLTCPICLENYITPKILPCAHTFCLTCLDSYVKGCLSNGHFPCAYCRERIRLPTDGVSAFRTSHLIVSLQDDLKGEKISTAGKGTETSTAQGRDRAFVVLGETKVPKRRSTKTSMTSVDKGSNGEESRSILPTTSTLVSKKRVIPHCYSLPLTDNVAGKTNMATPGVHDLQMMMNKLSSISLPVLCCTYVEGLSYYDRDTVVCSGGKVYRREKTKWIDISPQGTKSAYDVGRSSESYVITQRSKSGDVQLVVIENTLDTNYKMVDAHMNSVNPSIACMRENDDLCYLVTDSNSGCVVKMDIHGHTIAKFGQGVLHWPHYVDVGPRGEIAVSDLSKNDVAVFHSVGKLKFWLRENSNLPKEVLDQPYGVCFDDDGRIFVASYKTYTVLLFSPLGNFLQIILSSNTGLENPTAMSLRTDGLLAVADKKGIHYWECMFSKQHP